jgi:hypothetical protein
MYIVILDTVSGREHFRVMGYKKALMVALNLSRVVKFLSITIHPAL